MEIDIRGDIIPNDDKWIYDWLEWDSTCPNDIKDALKNKAEGEVLTVLINSGGGSVMAGQEIFSILKDRNDVEIKIQSLAGSAASVIAMANKCEISPIGMIMIHNVSAYGVGGDFHEMEKAADALKQMNSALAVAYEHKTGMSHENVLGLMDKETWITAGEALTLGFVDKISEPKTQLLNSIGMRLTEDIRAKVMEERAKNDKDKAMKEDILSDLDLYGV